MSSQLLDLGNVNPELTINVFWDDFEKHLLSTYRNKLDINKKDIRTTKIIEDYFQKNFKIETSKGESILLKIISYTYLQDQNILKIKFNFELPPVQTITVINTVLIDAFDNQSNILHIKKPNSQQEVFRFSSENIERIINW